MSHVVHGDCLPSRLACKQVDVNIGSIISAAFILNTGNRPLKLSSDFEIEALRNMTASFSS
jgi:hypothetical protein